MQFLFKKSLQLVTLVNKIQSNTHPKAVSIAECAPFSVFTNMDGLLNHAKGTTKRGNPREGVVWKSMDGNITFKALNNDYLLMDK